MRLIHFITILLLATQLYAEKKKSASQDEVSTQLNEFTVLLKELVEKEHNIQENKEFVELKDEFHLLKTRLNSYDLFIKETNSNISNQLAASSRNLTLISIFSGILILLLGAHVSIIKEKITKLTDENKDLLNQTLKAKNDVERINNEIKNRIPELYKKIKREEVDSCLTKLREKPEFISNFFNLLATAELSEDDFFRLKDSLLHLSDSSHNDSYLVLLLQHFATETLMNPEVSPIATTKIRSIHRNFSSLEMVSLTNEVMSVIKTKTIKRDTDLITNFFRNIEFLSNKEQIFNEIITVITDIDDQIMLFESIPDEICIDKSKMAFGEFLFRRYENNPKIESIKTFIETYTIKR